MTSEICASKANGSAATASVPPTAASTARRPHRCQSSASTGTKYSSPCSFRLTANPAVAATVATASQRRVRTAAYSPSATANTISASGRTA